MEWTEWNLMKKWYKCHSWPCMWCNQGWALSLYLTDSTATAVDVQWAVIPSMSQHHWQIGIPDCNAVTRNVSGSSSAPRWMIGCHMSRRPGLTPPPPLVQNLKVRMCENYQAAWNGLSQDTISNLFNSMSRRRISKQSTVQLCTTWTLHYLTMKHVSEIAL